MARGSLVPVNGPMLQEEATEIAKRLVKPEYADFKASSGWLEKWKNSYGISQRAIGGESEVQMQTIEAWMERLPEIVKEIWNMDESGCFFSCTTKQMFFRKRKTLQRRQTFKASCDSCFHRQCSRW